MKTCYMHIDVNSAFLSWTAVHLLQHGFEIDLRNIPAVIGGRQATRHGVVLAKSIPAKKLYGIKTGESLMEARRKAGKNLVVIHPTHEVYIRASRALIELLGEYSPDVQKFSIDEAFLNYTGNYRLFGDPVKTANVIKDRIKNELGFTVNIGVSSNKLLAKMACEFEKPDKVHTLWPEEVKTKMWPLPIGELYMVGRRIEKHLNEMGIFKIEELANYNIDLLKSKFKSNGVLLRNFANGIYEEEDKGGASFFQPLGAASKEQMKGVGNSGTIAFDVDTLDVAHHVLLSISETVGFRLRRNGFRARGVHVHYTTNEFKHFGMQHKFDYHTDNTTEIYKRACEIFDGFWQGERIRQIGIRTFDLTDNAQIQIDLFNPLEKQIKEKKLDLTLDYLRLKYGNDVLLRGQLLTDKRIEPMIGGTWGNCSYRPKDGMPL